MALREYPYQLCTLERALSIDGRLVLGLPSDSGLGQLPGSATLVQVERTLFGFRIPHLPDVLSSQQMTGSNEGDRLREALRRQARLVGNLGKWKAMGFALRFTSSPERGAIDVTVVGRAIARAGQAFRLGELIAEDLAGTFDSFDVPCEPINTEEELRAVLEPISQPFIVEVRQREEVVHLARGDAYVVYPFPIPGTTWVPVFETMLRQPAPCVVSIYLEPTALWPRERMLFAEAAALAETLSDWTFQGLAVQGRFADPRARIVARLYGDYLDRLKAPFLVVVQVAGREPTAVSAVAQALTAEVAGEETHTRTASDGTRLPSGAEVIAPRNLQDLSAAWRTLHMLDLQAWDGATPSPGKERLRYLADAATASAVFRFPISIRGGLPGIRVRQPPPTYELGARVSAVAPGDICLGTFINGGLATIPYAEFNRHTLVAGINGSGKTTTCMHLLAELWERGIPFLVIEPAKQEYRTLLDSPMGKQLQIFTLGDEGSSPFRLNPLEILAGVRVETHISAVAACLESALPTFAILPSLIEESLHSVYLEKGWGLTDSRLPDDDRPMPTLGDLYFALLLATEGRGYSEKMLQDIRAAATGRISSLLRGSKGRMLNTRRSIPFDLLMSRPTVLEIGSLNDEETALVMLFLLTFIREHCRTTRESSHLRHVTLIEEAHRVMAARSHVANREVAADTQASATAMFSGALSEVRAFGEGLIIAEQIPGRLAEDALKNTNVKIVHRLPGHDDRVAIGATMGMSPEQVEYVGRLERGTAAIHAEPYERPTFVTVPNYRGLNGLPERVPDRRVKDHMAPFHADRGETNLPFHGCRFCRRQCQYRDRISSVVYEPGSPERFRKGRQSSPPSTDAGSLRETVGSLASACGAEAARAGCGGDGHAAYCYLTHVSGEMLTEELANAFRFVAMEGSQNG